ncbi:hypothetical protein BS78_03G066000 [Paspalum vaginatum]|nr:hypothetical protein BS78_03G066000 [Paspalum vaginatum]KAJ1282621.1 hypothetical protein BS78_03G066000 [Paspalum vaginatum]KAJ1282622.1 hypothetical protein BS78_03G066000 [Paspalum vaginatum]
MYKGSIGLVGNGEYLDVAFEDSFRIKKEMEDLRSQLDEDVKELGYCEENAKLRIELTLKTQEMQCLRKQNEEMQARNDSMRKRNEELQAKNDGMWKWSERLESNNDGLTKRIEELEAKSDSLRNWTKELEAMNKGLLKLSEKLQAKNDGLTNRNEDLQANNDDLNKLNRVLQARNDSMTKQNEELQAKNDGMTKWNEELQAKIDGLHENIMEILEIQIDAKKKNLLQFLELYRAMNFPIPQLKLSEEDIGAKVSWDTILESVQPLKQAEPTLRQAASSFREIGRLQAQVTKLDAAINQTMANLTLAETKAALKEGVTAYAAELEHTRKKNEELESEKASVEQLMAMMQQVLPPIFNEFDLKIPAQEGASLKSRIQNLERIAAKLKELPGVIRQMTLELVKGSAAHCGSLVLAILKNQLPTLDVSVINQEFRGTEKEAEDLAESLKHLVEPLSSTIELGSSEVTIHCHLV